jgi:hypothetical protein
MIPTLEIDEFGNITTLYTDRINLYDLGVITNVKRASNINFNENDQVWEVVQESTGKIVHKNKNREMAIEWEVTKFQPGGELYDQDHKFAKNEDGPTASEYAICLACIFLVVFFVVVTF